MNKFDSIRPYSDDEVNSVLIDLSNNRRFLKMLLETDNYNSRTASGTIVDIEGFGKNIILYIFNNSHKSVIKW